MAQGIIQQAKPSKSGKTLSVQINGQWLTTKHFEIQNMVGQQITFKTSEQPFPDGNSITWLNDYTVAGASTTSADQAFDAAYAQHKAEQSPPVPQAAPKPQMDTQASIVAQALTKACTDSSVAKEAVWVRYQFFYNKAKAWDGSVPQSNGYPDPEDPDDPIPF